ncbi:unnamed protein product [Brassica rapa]|uniref:Fibronectin type III-like domain-containing protein n=2 Tax=Brassica TaxID=3705 RepID=A0A3P6ALM0_BRACM|nr:unnamed protein product [Brassica napus]CAG7895692.1 unnamed protein product [Brassica rapa]CDY33898.1 BnaA02g30890D [Brassica napus]VDC92377.1 unnamed protein product [Brassica rapa]
MVSTRLRDRTSNYNNGNESIWKLPRKDFQFLQRSSGVSIWVRFKLHYLHSQFGSKPTSSIIKVSHANCETFPKIPLHVEVSNTGEFDETHTVFAFAEPPENGIKGLGVNKQLVAFEKVHVTAGGQNAPFKSILRLASILV